MSNASNVTSQNKKIEKICSVRVRNETQRKIERILGAANKKSFGKKIRAEHALDLALDLVKEEHIKVLQNQSLTNEDRQEFLRQKYIETRGTITRDAFVGFMLSADFPAFLVTHGSLLS